MWQKYILSFTCQQTEMAAFKERMCRLQNIATCYYQEKRNYRTDRRRKKATQQSVVLKSVRAYFAKCNFTFLNTCKTETPK